MSDATTIGATLVEPGAPLAGPPRAYLVVREREHSQVIDLDEGAEIVLGRSSEATVKLEDAKASRAHARIWRRGGALHLRDLGSRNGTQLNAELVRDDERALRSGDVVRIGAAEIFVAETAAATVGPGRRLEAEWARLRASGSSRAAVVRVAAPPADLARMATVLARATLVEDSGDGELACLFADGDAAARAADELRRIAPAARVTLERSEADATRAARAAVQLPGVVVADAAMVRVFEMVRKVAAAPTTVLILGETGAGKEVVAEQIHRQSPRAKGPFVRLNCGSLPPTLLESELFGYEKGAFTGADQRKIGYLEAADGGTLFLDEIGELALTMQAKLLRVLEDRRFNRVGGRDEIGVDVRIVAATNRELEAEAQAGRFREDLYFRLSAFVIRVPPLRERPVEVALLAELFMRQIAQRLGKPTPTLRADAAELLTTYRWPGNVRELRNAIEHAVVLADGGTIAPEHMPDRLRRPEPAPSPSGPMRAQLADVELKAIEEALAAEKGNQTRAAKRLGISRRALIYKLEKYGLKKTGD